MISYRKQMLLGTFLLVLMICLGLLVISLNMEKNINNVAITEGIKARLVQGINYVGGAVDYLQGLWEGRE